MSSLTLVIICFFDYSHFSEYKVILRVPGICFNQEWQVPRLENVMKEEVHCTPRALETGGIACHPGTNGEAPGLVSGAERVTRNVGRSLFCGFCGKTF